MLTALLCLGAYLLGSVSFASMVSRAFALPDPRTYGSKNPGATNVLRTGNRAAAAFTLLGDATKGWLAVYLAKLIAARFELGDAAIAAAAVAAFVGHVWPVFYGFHGGKGVATALGVMLALDWRLALICAAVWLIVFALSRISSVSALCATVVAPFAGFYFFGAGAISAALLVIALAVLWRHRSNIQNLLNGAEGHLGGRS